MLWPHGERTTVPCPVLRDAKNYFAADAAPRRARCGPALRRKKTIAATELSTLHATSNMCIKMGSGSISYVAWHVALGVSSSVDGAFWQDDEGGGCLFCDNDHDGTVTQIAAPLSAAWP